ncbi:hypothetical protein evm_014311 [Chilo suppressalis]|nr:hypothetical protein evm_014311 [Chilo suppressalis]
MPQLFHLDHYEECLARRGVYCVGSFELASTRRQQRLFRLMQRYSSNWVDNFNHTRLHRGLCVSRRCPAPTHPAGDAEPLHAWPSLLMELGDCAISHHESPVQLAGSNGLQLQPGSTAFNVPSGSTEEIEKCLFGVGIGISPAIPAPPESSAVPGCCCSPLQVSADFPLEKSFVLQRLYTPADH